MGTYFHGAPEMQADGLQTLYLMNPSFFSAGYSDDAATVDPTAQQTSMIFLNSLNSIPHHHHQQQQQQHFVGIPLQCSAEPSRPLPIQSPTPLHYNLWATEQSQVLPARQQQGLSLSLLPQQQAEFAAAVVSGGDEAKIAGSLSASAAGMQSVLTGSKYLKAAQQLLDEIANVGKEGSDRKDTTAAAKEDDAMKSGKEIEGDQEDGKKAAVLSTAEKQELQMKKAKLVNMLDEVEQRYRQYHHQMQSVVSSFEAVAGFGSARTYTSLALRTISRQFRCLRDAISGQIRATSKSLGEEDCLAGGSKSIGSRLRLVDHHLRQQRALQQLGMIPHNAWRPQRGLPERAVSVLRAWLFEHFLNPYPKDSDKHMLAKQTGLTRSQVSNWFINARVRLWKPMVEEMYTEEIKEQEQNNSNGEDKTTKSEASDRSASKSNDNSNYPKPPPLPVPTSDSGMFDRTDESVMQQRLKKARSNESLQQNTNQIGMEVKQQDEVSNRELLMQFMDQGAGFGAYPIGDIARFNHEQFVPGYGGNGVSLTLGLPHIEPSYLSNESMQLGRRLELSPEENSNYFSLNSNNGNNPSSSPHAPNAYESINIQNRKRFAAQLLPDFVA